MAQRPGARPVAAGDRDVTLQDDDQEWQAEFDEFRDDHPEVLPCPSCGAEVHEETQRCPHCGDWIMPLAASARNRSNR